MKNDIKKLELSEESLDSMKKICQEILRNDCDPLCQSQSFLWHNGRGSIVIDGKNYFITYSINIYKPALADKEENSRLQLQGMCEKKK
jgi:hypothetical protein